MSWTSNGDPIHGEIISTDAHLGVAATLYPSGATVVGTTVQARIQTITEYMIVTDIEVLMPNGGAYELLFYPLGTGTIAAGAGLRIVKGTASISGGVAHHFDTARIGPKGYGVACIADAGALDVIITGGLSPV
jgi:hypothetical protein